MRKKIFFRKTIAISLFVIRMFSESGVFALERQAYSGQEKSYIVLLEEPALYSEKRPVPYRVDMEEYEEDVREYLTSLQKEIKEKIPQPAMTSSLRALAAEQEYCFTDILNGFTLTMTEEIADYVKTIDGVFDVIEDEEFPLDSFISEDAKTYEKVIADGTMKESTQESAKEQASLALSSNMIKAEAAYEKGYSGEGRAIAIIDSGIVPDHEYFKLTETGTAKYDKQEISQIITGKNLNAKISANSAYKSEKIPFAYNYYTQDSNVSTSQMHGVHVSGIAAGNKVIVPDGIIRGVAPEAQILFFCVSNGTSIKTSSVVLALEDAVKFEIDSVNISLGTDNLSENFANTVAEASRNVENAGISVVFASGNSGRNSEMTHFIDGSTTDNRCFDSSANVGSVKNLYAYTEYLEDEQGNKYPCGVRGNHNSFDLTEIADCEDGSSEKIASAEVSGKIALIFLPDKPLFNEKVSDLYQRALSAGAKAVVIADNSEDLRDASAETNKSVFMVSKSTGQKILNSTHLKFNAQTEILQSESQPLANAYSAYGYSDNLDLVVDFAAPGGNIYSAYNTGDKKFVNMSGTSMAAPHVTGALTLMYSYIEERFPQCLRKAKVRLARNILASTAENIYEPNGAISSARKVGSGLIRLDKAMETGVILTDEDGENCRINLGDKLSREFDIKFLAENLGDTEVTFNKTEVEISTDDYKYYEGIGYAFSGVKKLSAAVTGDNSVTLSPGQAKEVCLTVTLSQDEINYLKTAMVNGFFVEGKVMLMESEQNCDVGIPFMGFFGNWASQCIVDIDEITNNIQYAGVTSEGIVIPGFINKDGERISMAYSLNPYDLDENSPSIITFTLDRNAYFTLKFDDEIYVYNEFANKETECTLVLDDLRPSDRADYKKMIIELRLPYDTTGDNKEIIEVELYEDKEAPVFDDLYVFEKDGKSKVFVSASDNDKLSAVMTHGTDDSGQEITGGEYVDYGKNSVEIDITGQDNISYTVYDAAFNAAILAPHIKIDVVDSKAVFLNNTQKEISGIGLIAVYDGNGKLESISELSESVIELDAYDSKEYSILEYADKEYKLFFWSSLESALPLCDSN